MSVEVLRLAVDGRDPDRVLVMLATAIRHVGTGRAKNLEVGLGLRPGELRRLCRCERDAWLRRAADLAAPGAPRGTRAAALHALIRRTEVARRRARLHGRWPDNEPARSLAIAESYARLPARRQLDDILAGADAVQCDASAAPAAYGSWHPPSEASAA
jgi:hypothetical protein